MLLPPYHPAFVHFPIAFYLAGLLFSLAYLWRKESKFDDFAYWLFGLSLLSLMFTVLTGVIDRGQLAYDDARHAALDTHISFGVAFLVLNGLIFYARFRWPGILSSPKKWPYVAAMLGGAILLILTGHNGGLLVYELGVGLR